MGKQRVFGALLKRKKAEYEGRVEEDMKRLLVREEAREEARSFLRRQYRGLLIGAFFGSLLLIGILWSVSRRAGLAQTGLRRPDKPWYHTDYAVDVEEDGTLYPVQVSVAGRELTEEEYTQLFEEARGLFLEQLLGENADVSHIDRPLDFSSTVRGTEVTASYRPEDYRILRPDGSIDPDGLTVRDGEAVRLYMELSAGEAVRTETVTLIVFPPSQTREESLTELFRAAEADSRDQAYMALPDRHDGKTLTYPEKRSAAPVAAALIGFAALPAVLWTVPRDRQKDRMKARARELEKRYPELVRGFLIYLRAGLTLRNAWCLLADRLAAEQAASGAETDYASREVIFAADRLRSGLPERSVYEDFGCRCGHPAYLRLSGLCLQESDVGDRHLADRLAEEERRAVEEEGNRIRSLGEEAETRLMGPMMLYFSSVLAMLVLPVWMNLNGL